MAAPVKTACLNAFSVKLSVDGTTWVDVSGEAVAVELDGGEQRIAEQDTAENAYSIVKGSNKVAPMEVTIRAVYSEDSAGAFATAYARYAGAEKTIWARWTSRGGANDDTTWTTSANGTAGAAAPIVSCLPPASNAEEDGLALFEIVLKTPALLKAQV